LKQLDYELMQIIKSEKGNLYNSWRLPDHCAETYQAMFQGMDMSGMTIAAVSFSQPFLLPRYQLH